MYLRRTQRRKNGKDHDYWSIVESRRLANGRVVQRHVLYLGKINDAQERAWLRSIKVFQDNDPQPQTMALFPEDRVADDLDDVCIPTSDGRTLILQRYTHPKADVRLLLGRLKSRLPAQPPPRITVAAAETRARM